MKSVDQDVMDAIKNFARAMPIPFDHHIAIRFFHADPTKVLYPFMKSPPDNIEDAGRAIWKISIA